MFTIKLEGPKDGPYEGYSYSLDFDILDDYPKGGMECFINPAMYHLNVI